MSNDITVKLRADAGPLKRGMDDGAKSVRGFSRDSEEMAKRVAKAGAVVITSIAAITAGVIVMAKEAAAAGVEIKNLAAQASVGTTDFQKMAAASRSVGFEQEKLSDILKDVNDKFGDYMATGAGPLADFFEQIAPKIGVTADMFAKLSGPDALQLYVSSLEKAGVSQQEMTFYMEALASDATRLLPLLRDNGREMARLGDEAQRSGRIMETSTIEAAVDLDRAMTDMGQSLKTAVNSALLENSDELVELARVMTETVIPAIGEMVGFFASIVNGLAGVSAAAIQAAVDLKTFADAEERNTGGQGRAGRRQRGAVEGDAATGADITSGGPLGAVVNTRTGERSEGAALVNPGEGSEAGRGVDYFTQSTEPLFDSGEQGRVGAGAGPSPDDILQAQADAHKAAYDARQEQLKELEDQTSGHADRMVDIEQMRADEEIRIAEALAQAKKQAMSTMFSDLSSLMGSENDKLFKIGKAASLAQATVNGLESAVAAWNAGMSVGGPAAPAIAAAYAGASLAKTGMLISQIQSAGKNGGGSSSGGGGGGATGAGGGGAAQQDVTTFSFTLQNDPMGFGESFARQMIEQLNETQRNGGQIRGVLNT